MLKGMFRGRWMNVERNVERKVGNAKPGTMAYSVYLYIIVEVNYFISLELP